MGNFKTYAPDSLPPMLVIFGGLPGTGKTTIARELSSQLGAMYVRIDSIEQAIRDSGTIAQPINDAGYRVAYAIAEDNLRLGHTVIADSVNPLQITRSAWLNVAKRVGVASVEIEVICSDRVEHRRRVETRSAIVPVTWHEVVTRDYEPWIGEHIRIDTSGQTIDQSLAALLEMLPCGLAVQR